MSKRLKAQIREHRLQGVSDDTEIMNDELKEVIDTQIDGIIRWIEDVIAQAEPLDATKTYFYPSRTLGRMRAGEASAMTGLAPVPHVGAMRVRRTIASVRRFV